MEENPNDYYPTPMNICIKAIKDLFPDYKLRRGVKVLDAGCGITGNWGRALRTQWPNVELTGVDLPDCIPVMELNPYNSLFEMDFRALTLEDVGGTLFDMVIGNPPYSTTMGKRDMHLAEKFVAKSFELLKPNGKLFFFLRTDFLAGQYRQENFWPLYNPEIVHIISERVNFFPELNSSQTHSHCIVEWTKFDEDSIFVDPRLHFWSTKDND